MSKLSDVMGLFHTKRLDLDWEEESSSIEISKSWMDAAWYWRIKGCGDFIPFGASDIQAFLQGSPTEDFNPAKFDCLTFEKVLCNQIAEFLLKQEFELAADWDIIGRKYRKIVCPTLPESI